MESTEQSGRRQTSVHVPGRAEAAVLSVLPRAALLPAFADEDRRRCYSQARQVLREELRHLGAERQDLVTRLREFATGQEPSWEVGLGCARSVRRNMEEEVRSRFLLVMMHVLGKEGRRADASFAAKHCPHNHCVTERSGLQSPALQRWCQAKALASGLRTLCFTHLPTRAGEGLADVSRLVPLHDADGDPACASGRHGSAAHSGSADACRAPGKAVQRRRHSETLRDCPN